MVSGVDPLPTAVATPRQPAPLHLAPVGTKSVALDFDGGRLSSDAGVVLLNDSDDQRGLTRALAAVLSDPRDGRRIHCTPADLLTQRGGQIAAGYAEANDANTLRDAPRLKLLRDRLPATGAPLASQPTLSRFENRIARTELYRLALVLLAQVIAASASPPSVSVRDVDDTEAPVPGAPEPARYAGYDGGYGLMPRHLYAGLSGRLITTILQANRCTGAQRRAVLPRLVKHLRHAWPDTLGSLRGDSHCASAEVMPWIDEQPALQEVTGVTRHAVWQQLAREVVEQAQRADGYRGRQGTRCHSTRYQAQTWARSRRVVMKVEGSEQGVNTRCGVTAMAQGRTPVLDQHLSCARGPAETASKDHQRSLPSDRPACHRFAATPCRVWRHAAAYVFLETLRREV